MNEKELDQKLDKLVQEGPTFGQSQFQTEAFVIQKHNQPARAYRQILLELTNKYAALKKARIGLKRSEAKIRLLNKRLERTKDEDRRVLVECDIEDLLVDLKSSEKLVRDAIIECNQLWQALEKSEKFTSEEFEKQELLYWQERLVKDAQLQMAYSGGIEPGTALSLANLGMNPLQVKSELKALESKG